MLEVLQNVRPRIARVLKRDLQGRQVPKHMPTPLRHPELLRTQFMNFWGDEVACHVAATADNRQPASAYATRRFPGKASDSVLAHSKGISLDDYRVSCPGVVNESSRDISEKKDGKQAYEVFG